MFFKKKQQRSTIQHDKVETNKIEVKSESKIRNIALELFLNFGDDAEELINSKLKDILPGISNEDAKKYYTLSREVRENVYKIIEKIYLKQIDEQYAKQLIHANYPFINDKNCMHLCSIGMYAAWQKYNNE